MEQTTDGVDDLVEISELCRREGVELRGPTRRPYCCGKPMAIRSDLLGPGSGADILPEIDFAGCFVCQKILGNMASPRINGGKVFSEDMLAEHGAKTWAVLFGGHKEAAG